MHQDTVVSTPADDDFIKNISDAIYQARRKTHKNLRAESEKAYLDIIRRCREKGFFAEAQVAQAAIQELNEQYDMAISNFEQAANNLQNRLRGWAWFLLGSAYRERYPTQKDCGIDEAYKAIGYYNNALALSDEVFVQKNWAQNNLANIYFSMGNHDKAEGYYQACLNFADTAHYITHYNLGRLYLARGKKEEGRDESLRKYSEAVRYFETSFSGTNDDFDLRGACKRETGTAHIITHLDYGCDTIDNAIACWTEAEQQFKLHDDETGAPPGLNGKAAVARAKKRIAERLKKNVQDCLKPDARALLRWWPPEEAGPDGYSTPEERIFSKVESVGQDRYETYAKKDCSRFAERKSGDAVTQPARNVLAVLRGWGSATPLIEDAVSACRGGGYLIKWRNKGIIIDPGFDFLRNFRDCGFHMREVDAVVVSHNHSDHNFDLASIDDVFYEMHKRSGDGSVEKRKGHEKKPDDASKKWGYVLYCDEQTAAKEFLQGEPGHRKKIALSKEFVARGDDQEFTFDLWKEAKLPFLLTFFCVRHGNIPAYGIRLKCLPEEKNGTPVIIGFTCDTTFFADESDSLANHLRDCNVLVAHISQPSLVELIKPDEQKDVHLGYRGVSKLVKSTNPKLTILGEFWAGFADMRIDLAKGLKRTCNNALIIPSSIGLFIEPEKGEIECSKCRRWESAANIQVASSFDEFGPLTYMCSLCRLQP